MPGRTLAGAPPLPRLDAGGVEGPAFEGGPNAPRLLQLIWREQSISRAEIARVTGFSRSTVSAIVAGLLETRLVTEGGSGESNGGRRPIVLRFVDDAYGILGVDLGATHVAVALTNLRGRVRAFGQVSHPVRSDPAGTLRLACELADRCLREAGWSPRRLAGIGIAAPSPIDPARPGRLSEIVLPAWRGTSVSEPFAARYGVRVVVDNDANLGALGEHFWGAGRGVDDCAYIKIATGVGSGHIVNGRIYRGAKGLAGEIGHIAIDPRGARCVCGLRGCLTTIVGSQALLARANALARRPGSRAAAPQKRALEALVDAALARDATARRVVREAAETLGVAIADMLNLMNPAVVIIGGGMARLGEILLQPLREVVEKRTRVISIADTKIVMSELGAESVAVGAATLVLSTALEEPRYFRAGSRHAPAD